MTPERIAALRERVRLWGALAAAVFSLVREACGIAAAISRLNAKPGAKPMSVLEFVSSLTPADLRGYIAKAEEFHGPLKGLRSVIDHHARDLREDVAVGLDWIKLVLPKLAAVPSPFMGALAFAAFLMTGTPHNSGEEIDGVAVGRKPEGEGLGM